MLRRSYQLCHINAKRNKKRQKKELQTVKELERKESENVTVVRKKKRERRHISSSVNSMESKMLKVQGLYGNPGVLSVSFLILVAFCWLQANKSLRICVCVYQSAAW